MKAANQYVQPVAPGLFDMPRRLAQLQQMGDPLAALNAVMDWTIFVPVLARIPRAEPKAPGGRPAYLPLTLFKILVLQSLYGLSDEQAQFQILDRRSFQHFLKGSATVLRGNGKVGVFQEEVGEDDQFAHEEGEGEFFGFAVGEEAQVEGFENWVVA